MIPPLFIYALLRSVVTGVFFTFPQLSPGISQTVLYQYGEWLDIHYWGLMMLISGLAVVIGCVLDKKKIIKYGAFYQTLLWLFATWTYFESSSWFNLLAVGLADVLIWGYVYITIMWLPPLDKNKRT